jgi:hypothetical protein
MLSSANNSHIPSECVARIGTIMYSVVSVGWHHIVLWVNKCAPSVFIAGVGSDAEKLNRDSDMHNLRDTKEISFCW